MIKNIFFHKKPTSGCAGRTGLAERRDWPLVIVGAQSNTRSRHHGFSLVEVMVGMIVGLVAIVVIMQVLAAAEAQRRTTTSGGDAQVNGMLALRTLESDIRMAGYGLMNAGANLCPSINTYYSGGGGAVTSTNFFPVKIIDESNVAAEVGAGRLPSDTVSSGSDVVQIVYSGSLGGSSPTRISNAMPAPANNTFVNTSSGLSVCDFVLFASKDGSKACARLQVTGISTGVQFQTGSGQSDYNPPGGANNFPVGGYDTNDIIINMGRMVNRSYQVKKTAGKDEYFLHLTNLENPVTGGAGCSATSAGDPTPQLDLISNIVRLRAQYGIAPVGSQSVNCWTSARTTDTGCAISAGNWSNPPLADIKRIKAVRFAMVARSQLPEKPPTPGGTCDATSVAPTLWAGGPSVSLSSDTKWQCYRYRVFQTIVPIVNVIWANI